MLQQHQYSIKLPCMTATRNAWGLANAVPSRWAFRNLLILIPLHQQRETLIPRWEKVKKSFEIWKTNLNLSEFPASAGIRDWEKGRKHSLVEESQNQSLPVTVLLLRISFSSRPHLSRLGRHVSPLAKPGTAVQNFEAETSTCCPVPLINPFSKPSAESDACGLENGIKCDFPLPVTF